MVGFAVILAAVSHFTLPYPITGQPQPPASDALTNYYDMYSMVSDRSISIGKLNYEGWLTLEQLSLHSLDESECPGCNDLFTANITIEGTGEFKINEDQVSIATISPGKIVLLGSINAASVALN